MKDISKEKILQIIADVVIIANLARQMFFVSEPVNFDRFNCAFAGAIAGAYLMYRLKVQKCWRHYE